MEKKSVSASLLIVYLASLFAVIGSCFYTFVFKARQIKVENISVVTASGISVFNDEEKKEITKTLKLSDMETGIRPATGDIDKDTQVPSTINDEGTSEGYYASIFVETSIDYKIILKNIKIESKQDELEVKEERKNIYISIKDIENTTKSLEEEEIELVKFTNVSEVQKLTFFIWIGSLVGDSLHGSTISFELEFVLA